jgi:cytochrome oxidase assembly protein ShyY1
MLVVCMVPPSLTRRSVALVLVAVAVAALCVRLGFWQLSRLQERRSFEAAVHAGLAGAPRPVAAVLPREDHVDVDAVRYVRVEVTGSFDPEREVILYGRSLGEREGHHVLTPLVLPDGTAIVVDRGWVPFGDDTPPVAEAAPPEGEVTVTGILIPSEGGLPGEGGGPPVKQLSHADLAQLGAQLPYPIEPLWLLLQRESAPSSSSLPRPAPFELPEAPPHLSYAIQWFAFAAIALLGTAILIRRESRRDPGTTDREIDAGLAQE